MTLELLNKFSQNTQIQNFMKIRPAGTELFHADRRTERQTYMTNLIVTFRNSANAPSKKLCVRVNSCSVF